MKNIISYKPVAAVSVLAALLSLGACGERTDGQTVGQKVDAAIAKTGDAAKEAKAESKEKAAQASASAKDAAADAKTAVMGAAAETKAAVSSAGETMGAKIDDAQITAKVNAGLAADKDLSAVKINVDTKDGVVTLMGPVPNGAAKARAADIAKNVKDVKSVNNQLTASAG